MKDISLAWFFQIPGLFITIGVLLILIALLVLIIGSSKAKKKKEDDLALVDDVQESSVNQVESVNVATDDVNINHLGGINNFNDVNNFNQTSNNNNLEVGNVTPVVEPVQVTPVSITNDNQNVVEATPSAFSPLNVNESVEKTPESVNNLNANAVNNNTLVEPTPISIQPVAATPVLQSTLEQEPITSAPEIIEANSIPTINPVPVTPVTLNETNNNLAVDNNLNPQPTMSQIFSEPIIQPVDNSNVETFNNSNISNENVVPNIQPVLPADNSLATDSIIKPVDSLNVIDVNSNNSKVLENEQVSQQVEPIAVPSISSVSNEVVEPVKQNQDMNNVEFISPAVPSVNEIPVITPTPANNEVEEIL